MQQHLSSHEISVLSGLHFLVPPNPSFSDHHFNDMFSSSPTPPNDTSFHASPSYGFQFPSQLQEFNTSTAVINGGYFAGSTSDEADEEAQLSLINERKQRRMISNRESARRSRMRKQRHLDELWSQVVWLRSENHRLVDRLNHVSESHESVARENSRLKEEADELRQMLSDLRIHSPTGDFPSVRGFENDVVPCNAAYLRAEPSGQSNITTSMDLLG